MDYNNSHKIADIISKTQQLAKSLDKASSDGVFDSDMLLVTKNTAETLKYLWATLKFYHKSKLNKNSDSKDISTITMTVKDENNNITISENIEEVETPVLYNTCISKEDPMHYLSEEKKQYYKQMSEIPDDFIEYLPHIYSDPKRFNMGANMKDDFMRSKTHKGWYIYDGNLLLNVIDGFVYVLPNQSLDPNARPYLMSFNGKYFKWNKNHFDNNRELYYFDE
jgi:hypothetical protein